MSQQEVVVIGGGPGGYVAAIRLGQLGKDTVLVERENLGGVCLNIGCIPSKALIRVAKLKNRMEAAKQIGLEVGSIGVDMAKLQTWKESVVSRLVSGVEYLCKSNHVRIIKGDAKFTGPNTIEVKSAAATETIEAKNTIIATGTRPVEIPGFKFDGTTVVTTTEMLTLRQVPKNLVVVGAGVSGLEMATMYAQLGSEVTVIELLDQLLPGVVMDVEIVKVVERAFRKLGIEYHVKSRAKEYREGKVFATLEDGKDVTFPCDKVLVSVGRRPNSDQLGLEKAGVKTGQQGWIQVNKKLQTNVTGIYAIGDVIGPPLFAHKASKDGVVAAEIIAGMNSEADYRGIAWAIFTDPEIASVGLTEDQANEKGYAPIVGKFPFTALGRALLAGESEGFVKIVADKESELVLGVHIIGPEASDMISEAALAVEMGATLEDVGFTIHPHPTLPEAIMEAAEAAKGKAIHIVQK
ncbi:MAG TPA: dihydrolipoyl dehydrogenase [Methylomirabilota bacterium]|nr:dihydrolipoyl dehydrogenase [Methylomirabilota bacterium]